MFPGSIQTEKANNKASCIPTFCVFVYLSFIQVQIVIAEANMLSTIWLICMCVFTYLHFKHSTVCTKLPTHLCAYMLYCVMFANVCVRTLLYYMSAHLWAHVCVPCGNLQTKGPRCNAISHRANSSKIADSFVCVWEKDTSKDARLIWVHAH